MAFSYQERRFTGSWRARRCAQVTKLGRLLEELLIADAVLGEELELSAQGLEILGVNLFLLIPG